MKLEPTEAQRKAMATRLCASFCLDEEVGLYEVDRQIAAANSIPEGAPVGTIARRPDGAWKAERKAGEARPYWQYSTSAFWQADSPDWNSEDDADSWPQIRPDQWPDESGLEWFPPGEEPPVPRPDPTAQQEPAYTVAAASEEMAKYWDNSIVTTTKREPRVLPSLDGEEARDGTEWKFRMNGELRSLVYRNVGWRYGEVGDPIGSRCGIPDGHNFIRELAPYIEVLGDPS
ncbi:hypothetical protein P5V56_04320 [Mycobacteroides abscessus subsp. abscessus]|uniref:hypothetical protein n=1 Tax=Mycobacteroides abscessus TaxID=36809 RepID=UPI00266C7DAC|nr:hypothetical protein [Mycobacteroides abscessus]MDO3146406.1 hypothetical protein [Mycobacteroides abscessus subsp. abscessus]